MSVRAVAVIRPVNNPRYSPVPYQPVSQGQLEASRDLAGQSCSSLTGWISLRSWRNGRTQLIEDEMKTGRVFVPGVISSNITSSHQRAS